MSLLERLLGCLKHLLGQSALVKRQEQGDEYIFAATDQGSVVLGNR
jgi:hypothetical protein